MSKFSTTLSPNIHDILKLLPKGSVVEAVQLIPELTNESRADIVAGKIKQEIHIVWDCHGLFTGLTIPVYFDSQLLERGRLPRGVTKGSEHPKAAPAKPIAPAAK